MPRRNRKVRCRNLTAHAQTARKGRKKPTVG